METPICDFVKEYANENKLRLHMPGHKGHAHLGFESLDITEIPGADVLYKSGNTDTKVNGIIARSEANATSLFGTSKTLYSTEGSSLAIRAMLYLTKIYGQTKDGKETDAADERIWVLAGRNAHKTFMTASALLDIDVTWLVPGTDETEQSGQQNLLACSITPELLEKTLSNMEQAKTQHNSQPKPTAVYVTSPDYLGNVLDIEGLAKVCHEHYVLLLVDNAHGAYLHFLKDSKHPIALGADMCCDSAHKTLPVLTGGAYLHISKDAPELLVNQAEQAMSIFASTSPSYLIMQSLDFANRYLADGYKEHLAEFADKTKKTKEKLTQHGFDIIGDEPLKLTIAPKSYGYTGDEMADLLAQQNIISEFSDPDFVVMMLTPEIAADDLNRLADILAAVPKKPPVQTSPPKLPTPRRALSVREAVFAPSTTVMASTALGKILASASVSCPPAIPILMCGEVIDDDAIRCFEYYGINEIKIVL